MKRIKRKNAITLIALVITIIVMLLMAGVAIQIAMGEISYISLNSKALESGLANPQAELVFSTTEFASKYNVIGNDITEY